MSPLSPGSAESALVDLFERRLHDPDRLAFATRSAIAAAQADRRDAVTPDDLLAGVLRSVARFGVVWLGPRVLDLEQLGIAAEAERVSDGSRPAYAPETAALFDQAATVAREDGTSRLAPIHLLAACRDRARSPLLARALDALGVDEAGWRAILARCRCPTPPLDRVMAPVASPYKELLSPDEAAEVLGVHTQTLRGYIRSGKLDAYRLAGERAIRIRRQDLLGLLEEMEPGTPAPESN